MAGKPKDDPEKGNGPGGGNGPPTVELVVLVSGVEANLAVPQNTKLGKVAEQALEATENTGRPLTDWELRDEQGELLNFDRPVVSYHLKDGAILSLTLKAGVAG